MKLIRNLSVLYPRQQHVISQWLTVNAHVAISHGKRPISEDVTTKNPNCLQVVSPFICFFFVFSAAFLLYLCSFLLQHMSHLARSLWPSQGYENNHKAIAQAVCSLSVRAATICPTARHSATPSTRLPGAVALISLEC